MKINLNATIKFRPTVHAKKIYGERAKSDMARSPGLYIDARIPLDKDGFSSMQLWVFMDQFGSNLHIGSPSVAEGNDIIIEEVS